MKNFDLKKNGVYIIIGFVVVVIILIGAILISKFTTNETRQYVEDFDGDYNKVINTLIKVYEDVSCEGNIYFNTVTEYDKKYTSDQLGNDVLARYVLSYLDKNKLLTEATASTVTSMNKNLFMKPTKLTIKDLEYNQRIYNIDKDELKRENMNCENERKYLSSIIGYSHDEEHIYIDMNIGYVENGKLYSLEKIELAKYDKEASIQSMFTVNSYYSIVYTLDGGIFKLDTVELKQKF